MAWKRRKAPLLNAIVAMALAISASCGGGTQPTPVTTVVTTVPTTSATTTATSTVLPTTTTSPTTTSVTTTPTTVPTTTVPTTTPTTAPTTTSVAVLRADAGGPYRAEACTPTPPFSNCGSAGITMSAIRSTSTFKITHYRWNCGQPSNPDCSKDEITPMFYYVKAGDTGTSIPYTVTLTVEDERGNTNSTTTTVMVNQHY